MIIKKHVLLFLMFFSICSFSQQIDKHLEKTTSFFPDEESIIKENIEWYFLNVPEDWNNKDGKQIKLAVAILKSTSSPQDANPILMIDGGPGAGSIEGIWWWLNHPLREKSDIILMDARGTGFSTPRLCPELGNKFLEILAKDQNKVSDEEDKIIAALSCKEKMVAKGININAYHSGNIAKDLHALKENLKYENWNVYGVSYGTYVAQIYLDNFPKDFKALILDSPISDISEYYTKNTSNYVGSIEKLFEACKNDPDCNEEYPNLEEIYYEVIEQLIINPITVKVEKSLVRTGLFSYNAEDFKIAIHQALYQKRLIEVLPLLINQFHESNKKALGALVPAFSGALSLDYGMYYCVSCYETIPANSILDYEKNSNRFPRLNGGLSFYSSDFAVCENWNYPIKDKEGKKNSTKEIEVPTLIFTGEYDPITPIENGIALAAQIQNSKLIKAVSFGHASSFSGQGFKTINSFLNTQTTEGNEYFDSNMKVNFIENIHINGGISELGKSIDNFDLLFFLPLFIAFSISLMTIFLCFRELLRKEANTSSQILMLLLFLGSLTGISVMTGFAIALDRTASLNYYILAFGIPEEWDFLFILLKFFLLLVLITVVYYIIFFKTIHSRSIFFAALFSNLLIGVYFLFWEIYPLFGLV